MATLNTQHSTLNTQHSTRHCISYGIVLVICCGLAGQAAGNIYYVSPTGNDNNSGISANSPWQTLSKVNSTSFAPGSDILFQDGGNWYGQQLIASSSGTPSDPITYGNYGTGTDPTFWGSVVVPATAFEPVANATNTYFYPTTTTVNSFLVNHQFTHSASLVSGLSTAAGNIGYVESTSNTWYYDGSASTPGLYVNTGGPITSSNIYTAPVVQNVVNSNSRNDLVFNNLTVRESAAYNGGMAFNIFGSTNVQVLNCTAIATGKHAFACEDSTGFVGKNLTASYAMPDQGFGGASAFTAYADYRYANTTSQWINDTSTNPNGPYDAMYSHSTPSATDPTPIAGLTIQNMNVSAWPDMGIGVVSSGNEKVAITGGHMDNGPIGIFGNNATIDGVLLTGPNGTIQLYGNNNVIQNTIISGATADWRAGRDGAIIDAGQGNVIRFNTIVLGQEVGGSAAYGAAIGLESNNTNTQIYGNIIDTPFAAFFQHDTGTPAMQAFDNLFAGAGKPQVIYYYDASPSIPISDLPTTISFNELFGDPQFINAANGDFSLQPGSMAAYVFDPATDQYVMHDYYGNLRPLGLESLGAIEVQEPASLALLLFPIVIGIPLFPRSRRKFRTSFRFARFPLPA